MKVEAGFAFDCATCIVFAPEKSEFAPIAASVEAIQHGLLESPGTVREQVVHDAYDPVLTFIGISNEYLSLIKGSIYVQEVPAVFGTFPSGHTIAAARETHAKAHKARRSRMPHAPRAFIHTCYKSYIFSRFLLLRAQKTSHTTILHASLLKLLECGRKAPNYH